jgi:hypothetical protein
MNIFRLLLHPIKDPWPKEWGSPQHTKKKICLKGDSNDPTQDLHFSSTFIHSCISLLFFLSPFKFTRLQGLYRNLYPKYSIIIIIIIIIIFFFFFFFFFFLLLCLSVYQHFLLFLNSVQKLIHSPPVVLESRSSSKILMNTSSSSCCCCSTSCSLTLLLNQKISFGAKE